MKILFSSTASEAVDAIAVGVDADNQLTASARSLDSKTGGSITRAIEGSTFSGKKGELLEILAPTNIEAKSIIVLGLGVANEVTETQLNSLGGSIVVKLGKSPYKSIELRIDSHKVSGMSAAEASASIAMGAYLRAWRFDKYRTKEKPEEKPQLQQITLVVQEQQACEQAFGTMQKVADGVRLTRELVSEPANVLNPETFAARAKALSKLGLEVELLGEKKLKALGMNALLGVGEGSAKESHVVVMHWNGGQKNQPPIAFVGKGVTFDTGGISLKPAAGMEEMKTDMGGSAVVCGLMASLAARKANVNAVGVIGVVENMPSGSAQRPGDIVTSMSGQTIEVLNTDAEGRLVLADVLWYTQDRFKPQIMVNLATLTGAIVIALGHEYAGLFSNDDALSKKIIDCGKQVNEKVWRFPLSKAYDKDIDSPVADMKNLGDGRNAGSIAAGQFLQRFVNDVPWAHIDIAGVTWSAKDLPLAAKGSSGFGVRLLDRLVREHYEGM